jgi:hypothetical protein
MRYLSIIIATAVLTLSGWSFAHTQQPDFSGKWSLSGQIIAGNVFMSFAQICDLKQTTDQLAGPCHGPNGACSAVGVVSGAKIDLTCRTTNTNSPGFAGVTTFHGALGSDEIVRGQCSNSRFPKVNGVFAMMRV